MILRLPLKQLRNYPELFDRSSWLAAVITLIISILVLSGCGPKPAKIRLNVPYDLRVDTRSRGAILYWKINRKGDAPIGGYNIYLADTPEATGELYNSGAYPGDTDGDITRESIELNRLINGRRYYVYVRTILADGALSEPSLRTSFMPLSKGRITISQNHTTDKSGYSFAKEKYTPVRDLDNDLYIFATSDKVGISSPSRLHPSLRKSLIKIEGAQNSKFSQSQPLIKGRTYILKTAEGGRALLTLIGFSGKQPRLMATFDYTYFPPGVEP